MTIDTRTTVHVLVDRLPAVQLLAVELLLQSMLDPVARKLAMAPIDDEPYTEEERRAVGSRR